MTHGYMVLLTAGLISGMQGLYIQSCDPTTGAALVVAPPIMQLPSYSQYGPSHPPTYGSYVMSTYYPLSIYVP